MNKVIAINLGGNAYQLEEGGYDALRAYLENAAATLQGNPDRDEIIADIEQAIAEKFRALNSSHKTVVTQKEITAVLAEMGPIEAETAEGGKSGPGSAPAPEPTEEKTRTKPEGHPRRLYRINDGAMAAGVCNGIGVYLNLDPTFVRLAFVFLTLIGGSGLIVYIVMAIVVPEARTAEEKASASGGPATAKEFIRRAQEGYYAAMKGFPDRKARREWERRFKRDFRSHADQWQYNWQSFWTEHAPFQGATGIALLFISLLHGILTVVWICALISLLATGAVFGVALPSNVPVWLAAIVLIVLFGLVVGPLKMARRMCYWGLGRPKWTWSFVFLLDAVVGIAVATALLWLAVLHFPELREALHSIQTLAHQGAADIRSWWNTK
jgi:phage shock protein PspC (stress-responsive transcriptional regulator)